MEGVFGGWESIFLSELSEDGSFDKDTIVVGDETAFLELEMDFRSNFCDRSAGCFPRIDDGDVGADETLAKIGGRLIAFGADEFYEFVDVVVGQIDVGKT